jgi:putative ABC transport system permease protein
VGSDRQPGKKSKNRIAFFMLKHYILSITRRLTRDRQSAILNLIGLSSGLACTLLIFLWVSDERSVDKFNEKDNRLYLVLQHATNGDNSISVFEVTQALLAQSMKESLPEVEDAVSVRMENDPGVVSSGNKNFKASMQFADKDFFNVFSYRLLAGNKASPLGDKSGVLISDKLAMTLFHTTDNLLGKTIKWDHNDEWNGLYTISGVYQTPPANATDQFDMLFPYTVYATKEGGTDGDIGNWGSHGTHTYVLLKKGTDVAAFNQKIKDFTRKKMMALYGNDNYWAKYEGTISLQRYSERYLYNRFENGVQAGGRIQYVRLFSIIALFILVIACINFMNLSTAKATSRMKEVGVRKVIGASRMVLLGQFMGESVLMAFLSLAIALLLVSLLLPAFNQLTGKQMELHFSSAFVLTLAAITLVTGILAGSYPAWYLSGFKPVWVLKGKSGNTPGESWVRRGLVVFQFTLSLLLIISVMVIYKQMNFIRTRNLGYDRDDVVHFASEGNLAKQLPAFLNEAGKIPGVVSASGMDGDMTGHYSHGGSGIDWPGKSPNIGVEFEGLNMDYGMIEILGLHVKEGRAFSSQFPSDSNAIVFNEAAIAAMNLQNPVGQTVTTWGKKKTIVGVVRDFQYHSMYKAITPFFLTCSPKNRNVYVRIKAGTEAATLSRLEQLYGQFNKGVPFEYAFLDQDYQALYASEQRVAVLSRYFAGIAIIISCLGLFGLAAFTAQKRQKEMSIRKVVGADASTIALLLSKESFGLLMISMLAGFPLAAWVMHRWLESFAYRVEMGWVIFVVAAGAVALLTLLTVSFHAIKAAMANPVKVLRSE